MARVSRRPKTRKKRSKGRQERRESQGKVQAVIDEDIARLVKEVMEQSLRDEVTSLLGRAKGERRNGEDLAVVDACCNRCGTQHRGAFYRGGYYGRGITTFEVWCRIQVPRISCVCGGMVDFEFPQLVPYGRLWFDVEERARELAGLCVSLRDGVQVLAWRNGAPLSIATINGVVNQTAELAKAFHSGHFERVPAVVMLDGIWLKVMEPTGEKYVDKKGRCRDKKKVRKFPLLVAYGVDPVSGKGHLLDWERGREEDQESWQRLLERLLERGLCAARGLRLMVNDGSAGLKEALEIVYFGPGVEYQRCVFHKLRNVLRDVEGEEDMSRKERRKRRTEVLRDATEVYRGKDREEIKRRLEQFANKWKDREPRAVATLERDFEATIVYLDVLERARHRGEEWKAECLRTTSPLERVQRHFRQKARQVVIFHSQRGVEADIQLVTSHHHLDNNSREHWAKLLEEALLVA